MKAFLLAFALAFVAHRARRERRRYHRFWASCNYDAADVHDDDDARRRAGLRERRRYEGYQWGGGCWNYDDVDSYSERPAGRS